MSKLAIRRSKASEATALTKLAHEAKRYWDYPAHYMRLWANDLTLDPNFITNNLVYTVLHEGVIVGVYAIVGEGPARQLEHFWVHPQHIGQGIGRQMFQHAVANVRRTGARALEIVSDPNAEGFYLRMGAQRAGEELSRLPGRTLPRLVLDLR